MSSDQHISIDVMGGDVGSRLCVPASLVFLQAFPRCTASLVGDSREIEPLISKSHLRDRIHVVHADQVVEMAELPALAYRHKRQSSMWRALELVADGKADACVSSGNTGALMAMSRYLIKTIDGMSRPAICKPIPTFHGNSYLLDVGANLHCTSEQLLQFALLGAALARVSGCQFPRVALLNVGAESSKGNQNVRDAYALLEQCDGFAFSGFIEGCDLYAGKVDVVVCDGFVGNVALKVSEGAASFIIQSLKSEFQSSFAHKVLGAVNYFALKKWRERFDPSRYNGAAFLGLKKVVVKSHGAATEQGFFQALCVARQQAQARIPAQLDNIFGGA